MSRILSFAMVVLAASLGGCAIEQKGDDTASQSQEQPYTLDSTSSTTTLSPSYTLCSTCTLSGGTTAPTKYYPRAYVTSSACPRTGTMVAPYQDVKAISPETQKTNYPIGTPIWTSGGYMYDLLAVRDTGIRRPSKVYNKFQSHQAAVIEINGVKTTSAMYVCVYGADSSAVVTSSKQLSDPVYVVSDPNWAPASKNYYKSDILGRQFWAGYWDPMLGDYVAADDYGVGWYWVTGGTAGPFYNASNAYMRDEFGNGTQRFGMVVSGYLGFMVYRPDAIPATVSTYAPEFGGTGIWAPPVPTTFDNSFTNQ